MFSRSTTDSINPTLELKLSVGKNVNIIADCENVKILSDNVKILTAAPVRSNGETEIFILSDALLSD